MNGKDRMADFLDRIAEVMGVPAVSPGDDFRALPDWCSLKALGILVTLENTYAKRLDLAALDAMRTVGDLAAAALGETET